MRVHENACGSNPEQARERANNMEANCSAHACVTCTRSFATRAALANHQLSCTAICRKCNKKFVSQEKLNRHTQYCNSKSPFCQYCGQIALSSSNNKKHERSCAQQPTPARIVLNKESIPLGEEIAHTSADHEEAHIPTQPTEKHINALEFAKMAMISAKNKLPHPDEPLTDEDEAKKQSPYLKKASSAPRVCFDGVDRVNAPLRINLDNPNLTIIPTFDIDPRIQNQIDAIYRTRWLNIMSHLRLSKYSSVYNLRLGEDGYTLQSATQFLIDLLYPMQAFCCKINFSVGFVLYRRERLSSPLKKSDLRGYGNCLYFWPSVVNNPYLIKPAAINNMRDMRAFVDVVANADLIGYSRLARPNTEWNVLICTQLEFKVSRARRYRMGGDMPIRVGCGHKLPKFMRLKRCIEALTTKKYSGRSTLYHDHLCFFRCIARSLGYADKIMDVYAVLLFNDYYDGEVRVRSYKGFPVQELHIAERHFQININVFALSKGVDDNTGLEQITARCLRESATEYTKDLHCSLWNKHFSFINNINRYCNKYPCNICGRILPTKSRLKIHRYSVCGRVTHKFKGGIYQSQPTIFQSLQSHSIDIPISIPRYYPYFCVYDLEAFASRKNLPDSTQCMDFVSHHKVLSASVISNVPGFEAAKCFIVSDAQNGHDVIVAMLTYMLQIADTAYE